MGVQCVRAGEPDRYSADGEAQDFFGRRAIYILDVVLFAAGSLVVAFSHGSGAFWLLLLGRAVQGLGAGGIFPVASSVIGDTFPPRSGAARSA